MLLDNLNWHYSTVVKVEQSYMANLKSYLLQIVISFAQFTRCEVRPKRSIFSLRSFVSNFRVSPETVNFVPFRQDPSARRETTSLAF